METVEVAIKIPKNYYDAFKNAQIMTSGMRSGKTYFQILVDTLCDGTILPKGHGKLIDGDALIDSLGCSDRDIYCKAVIEENAPTIIEANKDGK